MAGIISDSAVWRDNYSDKVKNNKDTDIKIGMVRGVRFSEEDSTLLYDVEIWSHGTFVTTYCKPMVRFGGIYNYEEYIQRPYVPGENNASQGSFQFKAGDQVVVAYLGGDAREGLILGGIKHLGRSDAIDFEQDSISYISVFNGIETTIDKDGQFTQTFKGQPTNLEQLLNSPDGSEIEKPIYNKEIGGSYYQWDKTGSFMLTDNAQEKPISFHIDKPNGKLNINVGDTSLKIDKNSDTISIKNKVTSWDSSDSIELNTQKMSIVASSELNIQANNINITGTTSHTGDISVTGSVDISGEFSCGGSASLGGGANPLIYDIILTQGTGNLGGPVISSHIFLKTVNTKAT